MATATGAAPRDPGINARVPAVATVGNDSDVVVGRAPADGVYTVTAVAYLPDASLTGANTNSRTLTLYNRTTGGGTVVVAQLALTAGVNLTQFVARAITLSGTAANLDLAAGDVLSFNSLHIGTGIADPGGRVEVAMVRA